MHIKKKWLAIYREVSNGCTSSPDFNFGECCDRHDYHYTFHKDILGNTLTRKEADRLMLECIRYHWKGIFLPWVYWLAVRLRGGSRWSSEDN